ncbi:divergent PAP2 family protein [Candidatus Saccharibacteria bacterium]|nr:divergent PAP2 family protein [Candidatus Saccharibacteria bacterium]MBP9813268.1 divergent PAP2 family protein [Candidatus Saccharibacteria bacterium]
MEQAIYIIAPLAGWLIAQGIKFALSLRQDGVTVSDAFQSGGMPSSHTSFMVALVTVIGINEGYNSAIFGLSLAIAAIVAYDARGVRLATGQQTVVINKLAKTAKIKTNITNAKGHRIIEVLAGAVIGVVVGIVTSSLVSS